MEEIKKPIELVVDDGSVLVPVKNTLGEQIGEFRFRPSDFNIVNRYNEISEKFGHVIQPLEDANIKPDGEGEDSNSIKILNDVEAQLFEMVDYLFDGNAAEAFFGHMHAFSIVGGKFYCETVLNTVGEFISRQFDAEIKRIQQRVSKYTHGYKTGKHKGGKK